MSSPFSASSVFGPHLSASLCAFLFAGDTSTMCTVTASAKPFKFLVPLSRSAINVPRPGPSSTIRTVDGFPMLSHVHAAHAPMSSPNACDTSGEVTKSPASPKTSRCM